MYQLDTVYTILTTVLHKEKEQKFRMKFVHMKVILN